MSSQAPPPSESVCEVVTNERMEQVFQLEISMISSMARSIVSHRGFNGLAAVAIAAAVMFSGSSSALGQTPVPPAPVDPSVPPLPIEPGFSTMGVFLDGQNYPVVYVTNLTRTSWNGISVIVGNAYNFQTGQDEFMVVLPTAPGTVAGFTGSFTFTMWVGPVGTADQVAQSAQWVGPPIAGGVGPQGGRYVDL